MDGEVWAESPAPLHRKSEEPGASGSIFHFTAWFEKSMVIQESGVVSTSLSGKRILIVDDNQNSLELLNHILESAGMIVLSNGNGENVIPTLKNALKAGTPFDFCIADIHLTGMSGYEVDVAGDGQEAVEKYTKTPDKYNLILMDIQMPVMDGLQATMEIRKWEGHREDPEGKTIGSSKAGLKIPIVAMTANAMEEDRKKYLEAGLDDYITKPIKKRFSLRPLINGFEKKDRLGEIDLLHI